MAFYLGIDGGGSKTRCIAGNETAVLGMGAGAGSNVVRLGEARAAEALSIAIEQACLEAGISPSAVARTCIGAAGGSRPQVAEVLRGVLSRIVAGEVRVVGDMEIALEAAFHDSPGVIVIAGTGSIAYGKNRAGETARAGGWGHAISDEGSGHWIGRAAIAAALRALDAGESSRFIADVLKFWKVETREHLVVAANATPAPDFSSLFPLVAAAAGESDPVALEVFARAGRELAALAAIVIGRLFPHDELVPLAMAGGVFAHSPQVREVFYNELRFRQLHISMREDVVEPAQGALALARKGAV